MKRIAVFLTTIFLSVALLAGCGGSGSDSAPVPETGISAAEPEILSAQEEIPEEIPEEESSISEIPEEEPSVPEIPEEEESTESTEPPIVDLSTIPAYSSEPYLAVNGNVPYFDELPAESFESYSDLDSLGRCGAAYACIGKDLMPTEDRGEIGQVRPSGWHTVKYDCVDGKYLYNRCHLIGYQLTAENANEKNLITGTRYLNVDGMLPFENMVADYIKETGNHVLYRVTPVYDGDALVASGVLMEAESVEDSGDGILYCVYVYNVQPGVQIDYATGESWEDTASGTETADGGSTEAVDSTDMTADTSEAVTETYILNTNTKKFHHADCRSVGQMSEKNKVEFTGTRDEVISQGYEPCGNCHP